MTEGADESEDIAVARALLGDSSHLITVDELRDPRLTAAVNALAELISHHIPVAIAGGVAKELTRRYGHLDVDEMALFDVLDQLAQGGGIYQVWIEEDDLVPAMNPSLRLTIEGIYSPT